MKFIFVVPVLATLTLGLMAQTAFAAPGDVDPDFNGGVPAIIDDNPSAALRPVGAAINPVNGDILWAGGLEGSNEIGRIVAYKPDGTLDTAVGTAGSISLSTVDIGLPSGNDLEFNAVAVDGQGRIVATGFVQESSGFAMLLARFKPDGTLDTGFGTDGNGVVTDAPNGMALGFGVSLTADGHILVTGGAANAAVSEAQLTVWRYGADGVVDSGFGNGGYVQVPEINDPMAISCQPELQSNGSLIEGCQVGAADTWTIVRLKPDGSVDTGFGSGGFLSGDANNVLSGLALSPDGGFVISELNVSGSTHPTDLRRFLADGSLDSGFNGGSPLGFGLNSTSNNTRPVPLAVQPDGKIVGSISNGLSLDVIRLLPDGSIDGGFGFSQTSFSGIGGHDYAPTAIAVLLQADGKVVSVGYADSGSYTLNAAFVTRVLNDAWNLAPDALVFDDVARAPLGQAVASNAVALTGVSIGSETSGISVAFGTDGEYSTTGSGGPFMGAAGELSPAWANTSDSLALQQMTPNSASTATATQVIYGGFWAPNNYQVPLGSHANTTWTTTTDTPPTANDGTLAATAGQGATGTLDAANPSGGTLAFNIVTQPGHGTVTLDDTTTGGYIYTADSSYTGSDSFTWKVNDGVADSNMATVTVTVSAASGGGGGGNASGGGGGSLGGFGLGLLVLSALGAAIKRRYQGS